MFVSLLKYSLTLRYRCRFLPPQTKLCQGNVFTPVCDSVHGGVSHHAPQQRVYTPYTTPHLYTINPYTTPLHHTSICTPLHHTPYTTPHIHNTPSTRHHPTTPPPTHPTPQNGHWNGRYASYWNASWLWLKLRRIESFAFSQLSRDLYKVDCRLIKSSQINARYFFLDEYTIFFQKMQTLATKFPRNCIRF